MSEFLPTDPSDLKSALVVGIGYYYYSALPPLSECEANQEDVSKFLKSQGFRLQFTESAVGKPGGMRLQDAVFEFLSNPSIQSNDLVLLYYSGYALIDSKRDVFLVSSEANPYDPRRDGMLIDEILRLGDICMSQKVLIVLDCSIFSGNVQYESKFSSSIDSGNSYFPFTVGDQVRELERKIPTIGTGRRVSLFASLALPAESVSENSGRNSIFTHHLIEGLRGANGKSVDQNGYVTIHTLSNYLNGNISRMGKRKTSPLVIFTPEHDIVITRTTVRQAEPSDRGAISENALQLLEKAQKLLGSKDYEGAINLFNKCIAIEPNYADAWFGKGKAFAELGEYEDAVRCFEEALLLYPSDADIWVAKGSAQNALGHHEKAVASFHRAIAANPNHADAWFGKGEASLSLKRLVEAIEFFEEAIRIDHEHQRAWYGKARTYFDLGKYEDASKAYDRVLEINPNHAEAWYGKALVLLSIGKYEDASKAYDRVLEINPNHAEAWYGKALCLENTGKTDEAKAAYEEGRSRSKK